MMRRWVVITERGFFLVGGLIHELVGRACGLGGLRTYRSGWAWYAAVSTRPRCWRIWVAVLWWTSAGVCRPGPLCWGSRC
jgi:hypothetical protein